MRKPTIHSHALSATTLSSLNSPFTLAIDKREREFLSLVQEKNVYHDSCGQIINWTAEHLTIGDYIIFYKDKAFMVIERKTWTDLAASFRDGRKENIRKLRQYRDQTNARIAYLIEGTAFPAATTKFARIPYKNLRAHLDHLLIRDNIIELRSQTTRGSVERIFNFIRNISSIADNLTISAAPIVANRIQESNYENKSQEGGSHTNNLHDDDRGSHTNKVSHLSLAKVNFRESEMEIIDRIWCCIPAISSISSKLFRKYHISDLLLGKISEAEIAQLQYSNGRTLGIKKAKKIYSVSKVDAKSNIPIYLRIIATLPGISKDTARKILDVHPMQTILTQWIDIRDQLTNLSRGKTKLGQSAISTIEQFLIKK